MYLGKREILNVEEYEERRAKCIEYKPDATVTAFSELEDIINKSQIENNILENRKVGSRNA